MGVTVKVSGPGGELWNSGGQVLTPNTDNHPLNDDPPAFAGGRLSVTLTVDNGQVRSWDVRAFAC